MKQSISIQYQIKAILRQIELGKCKNVYAAANKVKSLKMKLKTINNKNNWDQFLAN